MSEPAPSVEATGRSGRIGPVRAALAACGVGLLVLNAAGWFSSLQNPELPRKLSASEVRTELAALPSEPEALARKATDVLHRGIVHDWVDERIDANRLTVPPQENFLLWMLGRAGLTHFRKYEFNRLDKAVERGVGLCSQYSIALVSVLRSRGLDARILALDGHVVVTVPVAADRWWVLDADYGVVLEHDIEALQREPELARPAYVKAGLEPKVVDQVVGYYGPEGNVVWPSVFGYSSPQRFVFEYASYALIWLIPLALLAPALLWLRARRSSAGGP